MANTKNGRAIKPKTLMLVQLGVLAAIMLIFHATGIGYIKVGVFSLTIMAVPMIIGATTIGKTAGAVLGAVFGITVLLLPETQFFMGLNLAGTILLCVGVRIFLGFFCGFLFRVFKKADKTKVWSYGAAGLITALLNTILMMSGLVLIFGNAVEFNTEGKNFGMLFAGLIAGVAVQAVIEAVVCTVIGGGVAIALNKYVNNKQ